MKHVVHKNKTHQPHLSIASDARAVRTRESLRRALLGLLESKPLGQITIRDIAATADIGYTTFFRHHLTKESLLREVAGEQISRLMEASLPAFDASNTQAACLALCRYVAKHRALWSALLSNDAIGGTRQEFMHVTAGIAGHMEQPDSWLPTEIGVIMTVSGIIELLAWWLRQTKPMPSPKIAEILHRMLVSPMMADYKLPASPAAPAEKSAAARKKR